jgi:hypothetical protein
MGAPARLRKARFTAGSGAARKMPRPGLPAVPRSFEVSRVMFGPTGRGTKLRGALLLADISGYTGFLQGVADAHHAIIIEADEPPAAYGLVSTLLDALATAVGPAFRVVKFEGDALFAVAVEEDGAAAIHGSALLDFLRASYAAFTTRLADASTQWTCTCDACARIQQLDLKFVVHHGDFVKQRIAMSEELAGPDVIVAHRLLKNHARDLVGSAPYALLSDAVIEALDVPAAGMLVAIETYDDLRPVPVHVLALA